MNAPRFALWRRYAGLYRESRRDLAVTVSVAVLQTAVLLPIAWLVRLAFDVDIPAGRLGSLAAAGAAIFGLYLLNDAITLWVARVNLRVTKGVVQRLREQLIEKIYRLPRARLTHADLGRLHAGIVQDTERVDVMSNALLSRVLPGLAATAGLCAILLYLSWPLFLAMIVVAPLLRLAGRPLGGRVDGLVSRFQRAFETFSRDTLALLQIVDLTRLRAAEAEEIERRRQALGQLRQVSGEMAWLSSAYSLVQGEVTMLAGILVLTAGGALVATGRISLGTLIAFYFLVGLLRTQVGGVCACLPGVMAGRQSLRTLFGLLSEEEARHDAGRLRIAFRGGIELRGVGFAYDGTPVLRGVDLALQPGRVTAVCGPSGAGKTTLVHLLAGFYAPCEGCLLADGRPYGELDLAHLRRQIGVVLQDPILFSGTVRENIAYGWPQATRDEVRAAATLAEADGFIRSLPQGYESQLGERGVLLSGGQRQRIAIARALLRRPPLLVLDEPTNHLGAPAVHRLLATLRVSGAGPGLLLISHDPEVLRAAERVYLLRGGRLTPATAAGPPEPGGGVAAAAPA